MVLVSYCPAFIFLFSGLERSNGRWREEQSISANAFVGT